MAYDAWRIFGKYFDRIEGEDRPMDKCRNTGISRRQLAWRRLAARTVLAAAGSATATLVMGEKGAAQTFNSAASNQLTAICNRSYEIQPPQPPAPTPPSPSSQLVTLPNPLATGNLASVCQQIIGNNGIGSTAAPGAISAPTAAAFLEERRRTSQEGEEGTPKPGASSDTQRFSLGGGLGVFVSAGAEALSHRNNRFEDGYSSEVPTATIGGDYRVTNWMTAGLAVNYAKQDGTYDDGGRFDTQSYGPLIFASFVPIPNMFTDIALGYNHQDYFRKRPTEVNLLCCNQPQTTIADGSARGNYNGDEYSAGILAGYDHPFRGFTVGPRFGLNYIHYDVENYEETSQTGLALRYSGLNQSSLQTNLGAVATMPISTSFGVVQPQIGASWVHEYLNDARNIQAEYLSVTDPAATQFTFQREKPARNWAVIDVAVSVLLPNQLQPFVSFTTIQGNENFVSYGGLIGARKTF